MIALYPGAYKPPHRGHFNVVKSLLDGSYNGTVYNKDNYQEKGHSLLKGEPNKKPDISKVLVFVGAGERNGITKEESMSIWNLYAKYLGNVEILDGEKNPMFAAKEYAQANPDEDFVAVAGLRGEEDFVDLKRVTTFKNAPNVAGLALAAAPGSGVRATDFRNRILSGNLDKVLEFFPEDLSKEEISAILVDLKDKIVSEVLADSIEGFITEYFQTDIPVEVQIEEVVVEEKINRKKLNYLHNYISRLTPQGTNVTLSGESIVVKYSQPLAENLENQETIRPEYTQYIGSILEYMIEQNMNILPLPEVKVRYDEENAANFFGRTAYYDPNSKEIVLYGSGRHPKDICRSFTHEMIHHIQNLEGRLVNIGTQNTNEDDALLELEKEAYLKGNITFRNWEDSIKNADTVNEIGDLSQDPYKWTAFNKAKDSSDPYSFYDFSTDNGTKYQVVFNREVFGKTVNYDMSFVAKGKDGKGFSTDALTGDNEPFKIMSTIVDITREQIKRAGDVEFITFEPTKGKTGEEGAKGNTRSKLYKIIIKKNFPKANVSGTDTVVVDMTAYLNKDLEEEVVGDKIECDNCDWSWNIKDGGDDLYICHKCGHDNEPHSTPINEGKYDKITNVLSKVAFTLFKRLHDKGEKKGKFNLRVGNPEHDEVDIPSKQFEFDLQGYFTLTDDTYSVDGGANAGYDNEGDEIQPLMNLNFSIPKEIDWQEVSMDIKDVVRHELEHLTQDGENLKPGKFIEDDEIIRGLIDMKLMDKDEYYKLPKEVDAMIQGMYFKAKKSKTPFKDVVEDYFNKAGVKLENRKKIRILWNKRLPKLGIKQRL